jgi:poly-beta-1,6-N-acetyl-D-glucosamine synthase
MILAIFWITFLLIITHYVLFSLTVMVLATFLGKKHIVDESYEPTIAFIIAAYNEERVIEEKILNDLELDYPVDKLKLVVVSDGSQDKTAEIVQSYENKGVFSLHSPERRGKIAALNRAVSLTTSDLIVFSDANSMFKRDALRKLVRHFQDETIGGVCGQKSVLNNEGRKASLGDHLSWLYESRLKEAESKLGSIPTADGEIFAMRRSLYEEIDSTVINDDTAITLNIIKNKKRVIYDREAITVEEASLSFNDDFNVKSRMVLGGFQMLALYPKELSPWSGWFGFQYFIHKTLRHTMWMLLIVIYLSNLCSLGQGPFYQIFFILQNLFYALALIGRVYDQLLHKKPPTLLYLPYYYCNVNIAAFKGFLFFLKRQSLLSVWSKAER